MIKFTKVHSGNGAVCVFDGDVAVVKGICASDWAGNMLIVVWQHTFEVGLIEVPYYEQCLRLLCFKAIGDSA